MSPYRVAPAVVMWSVTFSVEWDVGLYSSTEHTILVEARSDEAACRLGMHQLEAQGFNVLAVTDSHPILASSSEFQEKP